MADHYRRPWSGDTWHFCTTCPEWPTSEYDSRASKPDKAELCLECRAQQNDGVCDHAWLDGATA